MSTGWVGRAVPWTGGREGAPLPSVRRPGRRLPAGLASVPRDVLLLAVGCASCAALRVLLGRMVGALFVAPAERVSPALGLPAAAPLIDAAPGMSRSRSPGGRSPGTTAKASAALLGSSPPISPSCSCSSASCTCTSTPRPGCPRCTRSCSTTPTSGSTAVTVRDRRGRRVARLPGPRPAGAGPLVPRSAGRPAHPLAMAARARRPALAPPQHDRAPAGTDAWPVRLRTPPTVWTGRQRAAAPPAGWSLNPCAESQAS
jgi:hypothetical protein